MAKVINLRVENILGIREAEATLNGQSAVIGGRNGQGKSSLQSALRMALGGKELVPAEPVHKGAEKGLVFTGLDNGYSVEFSVTKDRKTKLTIRQADNPAFKSDSVTLLKSLFGELSFDPGDFMALDAKRKLETLMRLAGLDFSELNGERQGLYDERTVVGREVKRLEGQLSGLAHHADAPEAEEDGSRLLTEIADAERLAAANVAKVERLASLRKEMERLKELETETREEIAKLEAKLTAVIDLKESVKTEGRKLKDETDSFQAPDTEGLRARLASLDATNTKVRENRQRQVVATEHGERLAEHERLAKAIAELDAKKREQLEQASLPVDELAFDETGIRFRDVPLDQCSESQQWEIATAIAFALNPQGVVFMSRSGGMDLETRKRVMERAARLGVQVFLEVVDDAEDVQIVIDHGTVAENRLEREAAV